MDGLLTNTKFNSIQYNRFQRVGPLTQCVAIADLLSTSTGVRATLVLFYWVA